MLILSIARRESLKTSSRTTRIFLCPISGSIATRMVVISKGNLTTILGKKVIKA
ncbi:hypothetical protein EMCG_09129 [[Emmonsia] crescens]|uniref:Uncharacterized protein n=1 Tax=[Emmonsia] crescens TaxID=73230 RepID=A0A0G2I3L9_9EURO|nr:hypothetical protein EMCG_09129 [Emmonsia crescens UAMH 3008]